MDNQPNRREDPPHEEDSLDIKKHLFLILSNWYWFALSIFTGLFIGYLVSRYSVNVYSIQSSLIIRDDESPNSFTGAENLIQGLKLVRNTKSVQNEIGVLKSYSLAYKALSELDEFNITYIGVGRRGVVKNELYKRSPFKVFPDSSKSNLTDYPVNITILSNEKYLLEIDNNYNIKKEIKWGEPFKSEIFNFTLKIRNRELFSNYNAGSKFYFVLNSLNSLANAYKSKVSIDLNDKKGSILVLNTTGFVPEKEADYLNNLMQTYIQKGLDEKNRIAENTIRFIDSQLTDMTDSLNGAEKRLQNFRSSNKVINIDKEGVIIYESIQRLQDDKGKIDLKSRYYNYLKKYLEDKQELKDIVAPSAMGVEDAQLADILTELNKAYIEQEILMLSVNPQTPGLTTYTFTLETLKKTLGEKIKSLIDVNKVALGEINRRMVDLEREMSKIPYNERLLIRFEREFNMINKMYTYLNEKRAEAAIAKASNIADNKILDFAIPQNATIIKPNRRMIYINGFFVGAIIPVLIIFGLNFLNTKVTDLKEIHRLTSAIVLGTIGHNKYDKDLPLVSNLRSTLAESFRGLRTNLKYILREPDKKVITITSTVSGEGKTFIASNLALIIALTGKKVLLVGLDLRKPKLNGIFGISQQNGMSTYLIGKDEFDSIVFQTKFDNLFISPSGPIPPNPAELIGISRMDEYINEAKKRFDYIVIDTPPLAVVTDTLVISRFTDALLLVIRFNYSDKEVLNLVENLRTSEATKNIALVINDVIAKKHYGYSYGYGFKYGYQYPYEYSNGYYDSDEAPLNLKSQILKFFK
ncbi:MAG: polysaccharide biosynthesis tyrosine autokinase [Bacteroidales bacterium]|nr:polysaccharide biosynthesis tyrosine autokinase [Bacteroidales bacterium]